MAQRRALIFGIRGQDGALLARHLAEQGYEVHGTTRTPSDRPRALETVGVAPSVTIHGASMDDGARIGALIDHIDPQEIYHLAGQSSVGRSFEEPAETITSHTGGVLNILEHMRLTASKARLFHASSCEVFGEAPQGATEKTTFRPVSPYGAAKASAFWIVESYRRSFGLYVCSGLLSAHESPLRPGPFVTRRIVGAAVRIASGQTETLRLANLRIIRDWGWAPDYVDAMHRMLQPDTPEDFIIATGRSHSLEELVDHIFKAAGLDWRHHVVSDASLLRPSEAQIMRANPTAIQNRLGWQANLYMPDIARRLVSAEQNRKTGQFI